MKTRFLEYDFEKCLFIAIKCYIFVPKSNDTMDIKSLLESGSNISITVNIRDLRDVIREFLNEFREEYSLWAVEKARETELLTIDEVITMLGITKPTLWRWTKDGIIASVKVGKKVRYKLSEVHNFIENGSKNIKSRRK